MDDAVAILRAAVDRSGTGPQIGPGVRLARRTLRFVGVPKSICAYSWDSCATKNEIGRAQGINAALNRIQLYRAESIDTKDE